MVSGDGSAYTEKIIQQIHNKYPFGEWLEVQKESKGVTYTGRTIRCVGTEVEINQTEFINGRMDHLPTKGLKKRPEDEPCTLVEKAEFRSSVGNLHWVTSQTRLDRAIDTSKAQKVQSNPNVGEYKALVKVIKEVKQTADLASLDVESTGIGGLLLIKLLVYAYGRGC